MTHQLMSLIEAILTYLIPHLLRVLPSIRQR